MEVKLMPNPFGRWGLTSIDLALSLIFHHSKNQAIPPPKKLLLCHSAHLGDVILLTSLLQPLKEAFPKCEIGALVGSWATCVLEDHPALSRIHTFDHWKTRRGPRKPSSLEGLSDYDVAIDLPFHYPNFSPLLFRAKIPVRIGFDSAGFSPLLTHVVKWVEKEQSAADYFFELLSPLGVEKKHPLKPWLVTDEKKPYPREYILIHMSSGNPKISWPLHKWRELAQKLKGHHLVFTGKGLKENSEIAQVIEGIPNAMNLCDKLSWKEFVRWIRHASKVISVETSCGHVAATFDRPLISLYTGINPLIRWSPLSTEAKVITHPMPCSPCYKGCKEMTCLKAIEVTLSSDRPT
jgi:heptosyltransferase-2